MTARPTREELVTMILERLEGGRDAIADEFASDRGIATHFAAIDDLLPARIAAEIARVFPEPKQMRLMDSFREKKHTSKDLSRFDPLIADITFAFQDPRVVTSVAGLTGIRDAVGDPHLYAGGLSAMERGHFLDPHIDNSHDGDQRHYRVLNLLYYVTPEWKLENGGNLELWDERVTRPVEIESRFNRLVLMATNDRSWHSVNRVKAAGTRRCVSNYYFSPHSPNGYETSHVTYFSGRPDQPLKRLIMKLDGELRNAVRKVKRSGFARRDVYSGDKGQ